MCWFTLDMRFVMRCRMLGAVFVNLMSSTRSLEELVVDENYLDCLKIKNTTQESPNKREQ